MEGNLLSKDLLFKNSDYVRAHAEEFGAKTLALALLEEAGVCIPRFVAIPAVAATQFFWHEQTTEVIEKSLQILQESIGAKKYAVRSSAFVEDGKSGSHAGEFLTVIDVDLGAVGAAITQVIQDAHTKGHATREHPFSVIIQEYVAPEFAGVVFTRNPLGGRDAVIEWHAGGGVEVALGGSVSRTYMNDDARMVPLHFPGQRELFTVARKIEHFFDMPQDIEWALLGGKLYILQSRPITTITTDAFVTYKLIDAQFREKSAYYLSRDGVGESFSDCSPLALDVLRFLYARGGPVERAYQSLGVEVEIHNNFVLLHGALYVDKESELKQFFPAYGYVPTALGMIARIERGEGLWRTIKNTYRLSNLATPTPLVIKKMIDAHVLQIARVSSGPQVGIKDVLALIALIYKDIFLVNLFAEQVFRKTEKALARVPFNLTTLLQLPLGADQEVKRFFPIEQEKVMQGNSINIGDVHPFIFHHRQEPREERLMNWWNSCDKHEQRRISKWVICAQEYESRREECRHLTVMLVSLLRNELRGCWDGDEELMYFATIAELEGGMVTPVTLAQRDNKYAKEFRGDMPSIIASIPPVTHSAVLGVSPGVAIGIVATSDESFSGETILLTERLTPSLAPLLTRVKGIIAIEGGLLSHMAILAREHGVPVVIDPKAREKFHIGDSVTMDGNLGKVSHSK